MNEIFDADFFKTDCGMDYANTEHWESFFGGIASNIIRTFDPQTVMDAGCAFGYLVAALRDRGVEAYGFDVSEYAIKNLCEGAKDYCFFHSITEPLPEEYNRKYDLVITIEVLEHLYPELGNKAIANLCKYSDTIVFTSTPSDYNNKTHFNVRQSEYWCMEFAKNSFFRDPYHPVDFICSWAMTFTKKEDIALATFEHELCRRIEIARIHNELLKKDNEISDRQQEIVDKESVISKQQKEITKKEAEIVELEQIKTECENMLEIKQLELDEKEEQLEVTHKTLYDMNSKIDTVLQSMAEKKELLTKTEAELSHYKELYSITINIHDENLRELTKYKSCYESISNATFWKITKPLRFAVSGLKAVLHKIPGMKSVFKVLKSMKHYGFQYTVGKTKFHFNHKKQSKLYINKSSLTPDERKIQENYNLPKHVKFSIITPIYNTPEKYLRDMIESVLRQTYKYWELCLIDVSDVRHSYVSIICEEYKEKDKRVLYKKLDENPGIAQNSNSAIDMATGDYIVLLDHDDVLSECALFENAYALQNIEADVIYSDEDRIDKNNTRHYLPFYKPDWSPDLLYSQMYICHLLVIKKELLDFIGKFESKFDGSQDYDLMLRLSERTKLIYHISKVLYSWRESKLSASVNAESKPYAQNAGLNALNAHLLRKYNGMAYANNGPYPFTYDVRFNTMGNRPLVSIIIPMRDKFELTAQSIRSIIEKSSYDNWEVLVINNRSSQQESFEWLKKITDQDSRIHRVEADFDFNWSKLNNLGMQYAKGDVYIFLNNGITAITPDWIERLSENALRDDIGIVGPLLLFEDNRIQHAGVIVGMGGWADHIFKGMEAIHFGSPYVSPMVRRNVLAVTGACLAVSRKTIEKIGMFDEKFTVCGSDVELCLRAYDSGLYNLYEANTKLYHLESKSLDTFIPNSDFELSQEVYEPYRENIDPYFNINLNINEVVPTPASEENIDFKPFINYLKRNCLIKNITPNVHFEKSQNI
ncbi:MAG: glycosyltransferase [Clostridiales bacterium]|nr:glycosyltransferase [Clostridiales bacterium]